MDDVAASLIHPVAAEISMAISLVHALAGIFPDEDNCMGQLSLVQTILDSYTIQDQCTCYPGILLVADKTSMTPAIPRYGRIPHILRVRSSKSRI